MLKNEHTGHCVKRRGEDIGQKIARLDCIGAVAGGALN